MNFGAILALIMSTGIFVYGLKLTAGDNGLMLFYDYPSVYIVIGGVISATALSFQYRKMFAMLKVGFQRFFTGKKIDSKIAITEVIKSIESYRKGESLKTLSDKVKDPFLKESIQLLDNGIMTSDQVYNLMDERNEALFYQYSEDAGKLKIVGKYPPAFGMMGTTMGMIVLLANLSGADAIKRVGPAMGVCLITTLYGTVLANLVFLPLADNLTQGAKEMYLKNRIIIAGLKSLIDKENPIIAAEKLNSYLLPSDRLDWKKVIGGV